MAGGSNGSRFAVLQPQDVESGDGLDLECNVTMARADWLSPTVNNSLKSAVNLGDDDLVITRNIIDKGNMPNSEGSVKDSNFFINMGESTIGEKDIIMGESERINHGR